MQPTDALLEHPATVALVGGVIAGAMVYYRKHKERPGRRVLWGLGTALAVGFGAYALIHAGRRTNPADPAAGVRQVAKSTFEVAKVVGLGAKLLG